jgi:hypothetical protein
MGAIIPFRLLLILSFITSTMFLSSCSGEPENILDIYMAEHKDLALHIHPWLEIEVLGVMQEIPANIGISSQGMKVIHTHDNTGKLHIESPYPHQFYLGDLFTIWGKQFDKNCIMAYCADENHSVELYVNNQRNEYYHDLPLRDGDRIKIVYKEI